MSASPNWVPNEFSYESHLGTGAFGEVSLVSNRVTGRKYAVKRALVRNPEQRSNLLRELQLWVDLPDHPNVVACKFLREIGDEIAIFAEYVEGSSIEAAITGGTLGAQRRQVLDLALQFLRGLDWAHRHRLLHADIKPSNLFVQADGIGKIGDFGLASRIGPPRTASREEEQLLGYLLQDVADVPRRRSAKDALLNMLRGESVSSHEVATPPSKFTFQYGSPEVLLGASLSPASDLWSWGLVLLFMWNGELTWDSGDQAREVLEEIDANDPLPLAIGELLRRCFHGDSKQRVASATDAIAAFSRGDASWQTRYTRPAPRGESTEADGKRFGWEGALLSGQWQEPAYWLDQATRLSGASWDATVAGLELYPTQRNRSQADLVALERAWGLIESQIDKDSNVRLLGATLCAEIGLVYRALHDRAACLRRFDLARSMLANEQQPNARARLAEICDQGAISARTLGDSATSMRWSDESIRLARSLGKEGTRILAGALQTKANTLRDHAAAIALLEEALGIYRSLGVGAGDATAMAALASRFFACGEHEVASRYEASAFAKLDDLLAQSPTSNLRSAKALLLLNKGLNSRAIDAIASLEAARTLLQELVAGGSQEALPHLGTAEFHLAQTYESASRVQEALASYTAAEGLLEKGVNDLGLFDRADELARASVYRCRLLRALGQPEVAAAAAQTSLGLLERLVTEAGESSMREPLADAHTCFAECLSALDRAPEARQHLEHALEILENLPGEPTPLRQVRHASALMELGILDRRARRHEEALGAYDRALEVVTSDSDECLHLRVLLEINRGNVFDDVRAYGEGLESAEKAIALCEPLVSIEFRWTEDLAVAWKSKAMRLMSLGAYLEAIVAFDRALELYDALRMESPRPDLSEELGKLFMGLSVSQRRVGNLPAAREAIALGRRCFIEGLPTNQAQEAGIVAYTNHALAEVNELIAMTPADVDRFSSKATEIVAMAQEIGRGGNVHGAIQIMMSALDIHDRIVQLAPTPERLAERARVYLGECVTRIHRGHFQSAWEASARAVADLEQALDKGADLWPMWGKAKLAQANVVRLAGNEETAREIAQSVLARGSVSCSGEWAAVLAMHQGFLQSGPG